MSEETGGFYSFVDTGGGLPQEAPNVMKLLLKYSFLSFCNDTFFIFKDLLTNGAFVLMEDVTIPYLSVVYPGLVTEALYVVDEAAISL